MRIGILLESELETSLLRRDLEVAGHSIVTLSAGPNSDDLASREVDALVCSCGFGTRIGAETWSDLAARGAILVVRTHLRPSEREFLVAIADEHPFLRLIVGSRESPRALGNDLLRILADEAGPVSSALRILRRHVVRPTGDILLMALLLGSSRNGVTQLAAALARSPRGMQFALQREGMPRAHQLLVWGRLLWFSWRLRLQRCSVKRAISQAGYADQRMLARSSRRLMLGQLRGLNDRSATESVLSAIADELGRCLERYRRPWSTPLQMAGDPNEAVDPRL